MFYDTFNKDLEAAHEAEQLVLDVFSSLSNDYKFELVSEERDCYYKGDIKATAADGREIFIEVKDDSVIHRTKNILCEEEVYYKDNDYCGKGNMQSDYDIYVVLSREERKIYVIDFEILRDNYQRGEYRAIDHPSQVTYCYLLPLGIAKRINAVIEVVNY
jgi:hypothetical protein